VAAAAEPLDDGEERGLAEATGQRQVLVIVERLVAEEQHAVTEQRAVDLADVGVGWRAQVDARGDCPQRAGERIDVDGGPSR
jgi:hypothetical protein